MAHAQASDKKARKPRGYPIVNGKAAPRAKGKPSKPKAERKYASYKDLPWAQIRADWETTDISLNGLTRRYAISSDATIRKRIATEGWVKNVDAIAANLALAGLAAQGAPDPVFPSADTLAARGAIITIEGSPIEATPPAAPSAGGEPPTDGGEDEGPDDDPPPVLPAAAALPPPDAPPTVSVEAFAAAAGPIVSEIEVERLEKERAHSKSADPKKPKEFQHVPDGKEPSARPKKKAAPPPPPEPDEPGAPRESTSVHFSEPPIVPTPEEPDALRVKLARGLAAMHIQVNAEHLANGQRMELVGNVLLARILQAIAPADGDPSIAAEARLALMSINSEKETLAGLVAAAERLLVKGGDLRRRALSMDPPRTNLGGAPAVFGTKPLGDGPVQSAPELMKLAQGLPPDVLMKLRQAAAEIAKLPPDKRPGAAPPPSPDPAEEEHPE